MHDIIAGVRDANPKRHHANVPRRLLKAMEELGEVAQAYLAVTSGHNRKKKSWDDVREELADILIVVADIALTPMPDREDHNAEKVTAALDREVARKLARWSKRAPGDHEP